ncbi:MAG: hypothetical protein ACPGR5_01040 [Chitinophagales bacterium]
MNEVEVFEIIINSILVIQEKKKKPIRIAINGIEGTGKTVFAKKLVQFLNTQNLNAHQVSIDGFHFNKKYRYKQGGNSAKGYYEDSYDEKMFVEKVLKSSQSEIPSYIEASHDLETDNYLDLKPIEIENDSILITDGAYLFKPIYEKYWDLKIYIKTSFEVALQRGIARDKINLGGFDLTKEKYKNRYHKASKIYQKEIKPEQIANIIIDNSDFNNLIIIKNSLTS